ncbi:MAG: HAD-IC family P-type ATPase, partial [Thermomonas sp.]|uniref:HAD-IC family P-type ATPase n=1 Tax=Thermomonas sp. TaxID=1971895 RepID=UPI0039E389C4
RAVLDAASERGIAIRAASDSHAIAGRGMQGQVEGRRIVLGNAGWMQALGIDISAGAQAAERAAQAGRTPTWLASQDGQGWRLLALLGFEDAPRPQSAAAIAALRRMGLRLLMLSGDNRTAALGMAAQVGLAPDEVRAEVLPDGKVAVLRELAADGPVGMVGDGINDAPALAAADVGFAMGSGTDVAMHAASVTLMRPDPMLVADAIDISRRTNRKIRQNLFWAFIYNLVGIPLAAFGKLDPMLAGAAMALSSVSVVGNALLLRRWTPRARN